MDGLAEEWIEGKDEGKDERINTNESKGYEREEGWRVDKSE